MAAAVAWGAAWATLSAYPAAAESLFGGSGRPQGAEPAARALPYSDVQGSLAQALRNLEPTGALAAFPGERFRPDRAITLGEFARLAAAAFGLTVPASADAEGAAVQALQERRVIPQGATTRADLPLSRLNLLQATLQLAGLGDLLSAVDPADPQSATQRLAYAAGLLQVAPEPGAAQGAASGLAQSLDLSRPATREEAVLTVDGARRLHRVNGQLAAVRDSGRLRVDDGRQQWTLDLARSALVLRNGRAAGVSGLQPGDRVQAVVDAKGEVRVLAASGLPVRAEWLEQGRQLLRELARQLTPEQWQAILRGDWSSLATSLTPQVYDSLMALGVAPWEAEALLQGDWTAVRSLANRRVADEAARRLGVSPQVLEAVLAQDWTTARQLAQQELLQRLIEELTGPVGPGNAVPGNAAQGQAAPQAGA